MYFDKVTHDLLLQTFQRRMIPVVRPTSRYAELFRRQETVCSCGKYIIISSPSTSGVIQGSCLVPICFALFVDELFHPRL